MSKAQTSTLRNPAEYSDPGYASGSSAATAAPADISLSDYRARMLRWIESEKTYKGNLRIIAQQLVRRANFDDGSDGKLRVFAGFKTLGRDGHCCKRTVQRWIPALCGEVAGIPALFTREPARPGQTVHRDGKLLHTFDRGGYIYTSRPAMFYLRDQQDSSTLRVIPTAGASRRTTTKADAVQAPLPPTPLQAVSVPTPAPVPMWDARAAFEELWRIYPKQTKKKEARDEWDALRLSASEAAAIVTDVQQRKAGQWKHTEQEWLPRLALYLRRQQWLEPAPEPSKRKAKHPAEYTPMSHKPFVSFEVYRNQADDDARWIVDGIDMRTITRAGDLPPDPNPEPPIEPAPEPEPPAVDPAVLERERAEQEARAARVATLRGQLEDSVRRSQDLAQQMSELARQVLGAELAGNPDAGLQQQYDEHRQQREAVTTEQDELIAALRADGCIARREKGRVVLPPAS